MYLCVEGTRPAHAFPTDDLFALISIRFLFNSPLTWSCPAEGAVPGPATAFPNLWLGSVETVIATLFCRHSDMLPSGTALSDAKKKACFSCRKHVS